MTRAALALLALLALNACISDRLGPGDFKRTFDCMAEPDHPCPEEKET